jgi:hypothetical protein
MKFVHKVLFTNLSRMFDSNTKIIFISEKIFFSHKSDKTTSTLFVIMAEN